jgi:predicted DNA-binding transcriptional regulator AlpA
MKSNEAVVLNTREAAEYLSLSTATLRKGRMKNGTATFGLPPHIKMGRAIRYLKKDLDRWLSKLPKG